jgi:2-polyprenyl-3-methyl-5-hydroxy-6-metoxy-1,4-benzoquinol methylase
MVQYNLQRCCCLSCGSTEYIDKFAVRDLREWSGPDTFYVRCKECQSLYLNPRPVAVSTESPSSYDDRYLKVYSSLMKRLRSSFKRRIVIGFYSVLTGSVHMTLPRDAVPGQDLLDVGCGIGLQTKHLAARGIHITGLDTSEQAIYFARQIATPMEQFMTKSIFDLEEKGGYDFVRMDSVLEHIDAPHEFLERIRELLKPRGKLILFTPNADSLSLRFLKGKSVSAWAPEHLILYSRLGIERLLSDTGFRTLKVRYNTPAWWLAYNMALLFGPKIRADSAILKIGSVILLPFVWIGQKLGLNEELIIEAQGEG